MLLVIASDLVAFVMAVFVVSLLVFLIRNTPTAGKDMLKQRQPRSLGQFKEKEDNLL